MTHPAIIMCPPLDDYPEAPEDQPGCELFDCPKCNEKMWLSKKKRSILLFASMIEKDIILACYHCITQMNKANPELIADVQVVNL